MGVRGDGGRSSNDPVPIAQRAAVFCVPLASRQYRVVVIDARGSSVIVVPLERAPDLGSELVLPHGERVLVRHVASSDDPGIVGVVIAGPTG